MNNPFTEAEQYEYNETMRERREEQRRQEREDAWDLVEDENDQR
jgi:hypothetical protein